jgi:acetyl esterase
MALSPESRRVLTVLAALKSPPVELMTPDEARADRARHADTTTAFAGPAVELPRVEDRRIPAPGREIPVRVYWPSFESSLPALVFFHGGGWVLGNLDAVDRSCRALAASSGCVVVSVDYRLAPEHKFPAPLEDAFDAVSYVARHAHGYGIDPARIAVGGDSAGGNLAAACALMARERGGPAIAFQLLIYPATDRYDDSPSTCEYADGHRLTRAGMEWFWKHYLAAPEQGREPYVSPSYAADLAVLPPAFVITAECDPIRDQGEKYAARLAEAGVPVRLKRYEGAIHGFFQMGAVIPAGAEAVADAAGAMRDALQAEPVRPAPSSA